MKKAESRYIGGDLLTLEQAALRVNLGISTVRKYANECGAALKIGRSYRVNIEKLIDYLTTQANKPSAKKKLSKEDIFDENFCSGENTALVRIDSGLLDNIKIIADTENKSITNMVNEWVLKELKMYVKEGENK